MTVTDKTGFNTLEAIKIAGNFNQWMFSEIAPFCHGKVMETGSGIGNISRFLINAGYETTLSDTNENYLQILKSQFSGSPNLREVISIDMQHPSFYETYAGLKEGFDCIVMMNVFEHLENENLALQHCSYLLRPGGTLIVLVPAYAWLYSRMDKELGHQKRYRARELKSVLGNQHFLVTKTFYFNALGILAWLYGKITRKKKISPGEMSLFNHLTGLGKIIDKMLAHKTGLSVISIARKS